MSNNAASERTEKGLRAEILTGPFHAPNGGLSAHVEQVTIVGDDIPDDCRVFPPDEDAPAVHLAETTPGHTVLRPGARPSRRWYMASGAYVVTSDSRWASIAGSRAPLPLHDRTEW